MPRTLLSAHALVRTIGTRTILDRVSLAVDDATTTALVGPNGSGKSTFLRLLAGVEPPDAGRVVRAHGASVLHLPQLDGARADRSTRAVLHERLGAAPAAAAMDELAGRMAAGETGLVDAHAAALQAWLDRGGPDLDARLDRAAADGGLEPALLDRPPAGLSGGQRARAMLAAVTAARSEVLLLDEPANHLDDDGLSRLRELLLARAGGLVLVAHDRALLAAVTDRVVELDPHTGAAHAYAGGWAAYETERDRARRTAAEAHERAVAQRDRLRALERTVRARAAAGERNASAENDKNLRHMYREGAQNGSGSLAAQLARRAERIEVPDRPWETRPARLRHARPADGAGVVAALHGAVLRRGAFALGPLDLEVRDGDRILLAGPNGAGKSTIIAALAGRLEPVVGTARRVAVAEVAQERESLLAPRPERGATGPGRLVDAVREVASLGEREARAALAAMGLGAELAQRPVDTLSPGERTRAELATATAAGARLLLLDEPTNHLDVEALQALEAALAQWPGALVVSSHDARLRENLRLDSVLDVAQLPGARAGARADP